MAAPGKIRSSAAVPTFRKGGQGSVMLTSYHGVLCAEKSFSAEHEHAWRVEVNTALRLANAHAHVVTFYQSIQEGGKRSVQLELALSDLFEVYKATGMSGLRTPSFFREWMLQLAHALSFCHSRGVAHRDVKPENILLMRKPGASGASPVFGDATEFAEAKATLLAAATALGTAPRKAKRRLHGYMAKLCDLGSAFMTPGDMPLPPPAGVVGRTPRGSSKYACPEVVFLHQCLLAPGEVAATWGAAPPPLADAGYDPFAADVWSFGVTLYVMTAGRHPFRLASPTDADYRGFLRATQPHVRAAGDALVAPAAPQWASDATIGAPAWRWPRAISRGLAHLLGACLAVRSTERWTMAQIMAHPWFGNPAWEPVAPPAPAALPVADVTAPIRIASDGTEAPLPAATDRRWDSTGSSRHSSNSSEAVSAAVGCLPSEAPASLVSGAGASVIYGGPGSPVAPFGGHALGGRRRLQSVEDSVPQATVPYLPAGASEASAAGSRSTNASVGGGGSPVHRHGRALSTGGSVASGGSSPLHGAPVGAGGGSGYMDGYGAPGPVVGSPGAGGAVLYSDAAALGLGRGSADAPPAAPFSPKTPRRPSLPAIHEGGLGAALGLGQLRVKERVRTGSLGGRMQAAAILAAADSWEGGDVDEGKAGAAGHSPGGGRGGNGLPTLATAGPGAVTGSVPLASAGSDSAPRGPLSPPGGGSAEFSFRASQ